MSKTPTQNIALISFADLYAMYIFLKNDLSTAGPKASHLMSAKIEVVEKELYERTFGFNPHEKDKVKITGVEPSTIDLNKF